jgi:hypothetical protein
LTYAIRHSIMTNILLLIHLWVPNRVARIRGFRDARRDMEAMERRVRYNGESV